MIIIFSITKRRGKKEAGGGLQVCGWGQRHFNGIPGSGHQQYHINEWSLLRVFQWPEFEWLPLPLKNRDQKKDLLSHRYQPKVIHIRASTYTSDAHRTINRVRAYEIDTNG